MPSNRSLGLEVMKPAISKGRHLLSWIKPLPKKPSFMGYNSIISPDDGICSSTCTMNSNNVFSSPGQFSRCWCSISWGDEEALSRELYLAERISDIRPDERQRGYDYRLTETIHKILFG